MFEQHPNAEFTTGDVVLFEGRRALVACGHLESMINNPETGEMALVDRVSGVFIEGPDIHGPIPVGSALDVPANVVSRWTAEA